MGILFFDTPCIKNLLDNTWSNVRLTIAKVETGAGHAPVKKKSKQGKACGG